MTLDSRDFRNALGHFATGVCVITAHPEGREPIGMTVNSFASVSLEPPLILWSLQNNSELYQTWVNTPRFAVNVLCQGQEELSNSYAKKGDHILDPAHFVEGATGVPVMPSTSVTFECELDTTHPGGDHLILIGRVVAMENRDAGDPLLFCAGGYRELK